MPEVYPKKLLDLWNRFGNEDDWGSPTIGTSLLNDDVQIRILEFCDLHSLRRMMQVNKRYRNLIASSQSIWVRQCCFAQELPRQQNLSEDAMEFVDYLSLPTSYVEPTTTKSSNLPNLSFLLAQASSYAPSRVDETLFSTSREAPTEVEDDEDNFDELQTISLPSGETAVQFVGVVGQSHRCIRADQPLPRPTAVLRRQPPDPWQAYGQWPRQQSCLLQRLSAFPSAGHQHKANTQQRQHLPAEQQSRERQQQQLLLREQQQRYVIMIMKRWIGNRLWSRTCVVWTKKKAT